MGKRSKSDGQASGSKNKKKKLDECDSTESILSCTDSNRTTKKRKSKKKNKITNLIEENVELEETDTLTAESDIVVSNKKTKKVSVSKDKKKDKNKKVLFTDEETVEVSNQTNIEKKVKTPDFSQEDDVKDEDIDKFCEEIDEEDNMQYLNWVEQIEAKLNSNKKKPK